MNKVLSMLVTQTKEDEEGNISNRYAESHVLRSAVCMFGFPYDREAGAISEDRTFVIMRGASDPFVAQGSPHQFAKGDPNFIAANCRNMIDDSVNVCYVNRTLVLSISEQGGGEVDVELDGGNVISVVGEIDDVTKLFWENV